MINRAEVRAGITKDQLFAIVSDKVSFKLRMPRSAEYPPYDQ